MKFSKIFENVIIILFFLVVIAYPITAYFLGIENNLSGAEEKVKLSFETLDDYIIQNFPGREFLVRTKNQMQYTFFDISPNASITKIGDTLMSTETLNYYYHGLHQAPSEDIDTILNKFEMLRDILDAKGKKLVVVTTPTKPRYYSGDLPFADDVILAYQGSLERKSYEIFRERIAKRNINYFDCIKYINNNREKFLNDDVPLFYQSGHHWSNYKGNEVGLEFLRYLKTGLKLNLPDIHIEKEKVDEAVYPDSDLFNVLNIYDKPKEQFYRTNVVFDNYINDDLNFLIQGGSFLGGLMLPSITIGLNNKVFHIENKTLIYNHYTEHVEFDSYDDLDKKVNLLNQLKDFNIFIFEINELNVYNATFGFIDYLLEHEDML